MHVNGCQAGPYARAGPLDRTQLDYRSVSDLTGAAVLPDSWHTDCDAVCIMPHILSGHISSLIIGSLQPQPRGGADG